MSGRSAPRQAGDSHGMFTHPSPPPNALPQGMNIGQAAKATGISARMIRHYEAQGLLPPPVRSASGYRIYGHEDLEALRFIRNARAFGFCLEQIGDLIRLTREGSCASDDISGLLKARLRSLLEQEDALRAQRLRVERAIALGEKSRHPGCVLVDLLSSRDGESAAA